MFCMYLSSKSSSVFYPVKKPVLTLDCVILNDNTLVLSAKLGPRDQFSSLLVRVYVTLLLGRALFK